MALLVLIGKFAISCTHNIQSKLIALVASLATISKHFDQPMTPLALSHCQGLPYLHHTLVLSWYLHQPEPHQLTLEKV